MAAPANTTTTLVSIGNREDLEDVIYRVAPEETPFSNNIGNTNAKAVYHEWPNETLRAPSLTASLGLEGGDATNSSPDLTTRIGNTCQLHLDARGVSGTQEAVDKAGRSSEVNRQAVLLGLELKRDLEFRILGNNAAVAESGATTRKTAGMLAYLTSNVSRGAGGSSGGFTASPGAAAATNGTQRVFTEAMLKTVMASAYNNGGRPTQAYMSATQKQEFSVFTGIADIRADISGSKQATIYGAADIYVSDFGKIAAIPHPYALTRDVAFVDPNMAALGTLRGWKREDIAKTGDSERFQITAEKCLIVKNEKAHAVVADLN